MPIEILSPEGHRRSTTERLAPRATRLDGITVALHDNAKPGAETLLLAIGDGLAARGAQVRRWGKAHAARPTTHVPEMARAAGAAVFALGD